MAMIDNKIRMERARLRISQSELAEKMGVTRQTMYSIENNKFVPSVELVLKISKFFGAKVDELFWLVS